MTDSAIVVYTARGHKRMLKEGGSQAWVLSEKRAKGCKYVVCVQNRDPADNQHNDWGEVSAPHKCAFFIGKIADIIPSPTWDGTRPKKWLIQVSEYALVAIPDMWDGARNPVAYSSLKTLGIKEDKLVFKKMPAVEIAPPNVVEAPEPDLSGITIQQAKKLLAKKYEVSEDCIEIIIRA